MPAVRDPRALTSNELMKMSKKDITEYFGALQETLTEREKKYGVF